MAAISCAKTGMRLMLVIFFVAAAPSRTAAGPVVLQAVGDIMLAGSGTATFARAGYDYPFAATARELRRADIVLGNLEAPLTVRGEEFKDKKFRFRASPKAAAALKRAGFSVVTLANNHIMDFGETGLLDTIQRLDREQVRCAGAGNSLAMARRPAVVERNGAKVAFLAYSLTQPLEFFAGESSAGTAPGYSRYFREDIIRAESAADYVVVSFHWGGEGLSAPRQYQIEAARRAIDAGADVIIGHHPHVLQGIERYGRGVIFYSLGNFAFGSMSRHAASSVMARITLHGGVREVEVLPLNVLNAEVRFQPGIMKGARGKKVVAGLNSLSRRWNTEIVAEGGRYLVRPVPAGPRLSAR